MGPIILIMMFKWQGDNLRLNFFLMPTWPKTFMERMIMKNNRYQDMYF